MIPNIDLFHQLLVKTKEGFVAITNYTDDPVKTHVYTPHGEWCGCSGASNNLSLLADIRHIVKSRIKYEKSRLRQNKTMASISV
jgi:hypothetical protein